MSSPIFVGIKGQAGAINLIPVTPPTFWQRLGKWLAWFAGWLLWTALAFSVGYLVGSL